MRRRRQHHKGRKRLRKWHRGRGEAYRWQRLQLPHVDTTSDPTIGTPTRIPRRAGGRPPRGDAL